MCPHIGHNRYVIRHIRGMPTYVLYAFFTLAFTQLSINLSLSLLYSLEKVEDLR